MRKSSKVDVTLAARTACVSQIRLARVVVVTFGAGVTPFGVLLVLDNGALAGSILCGVGVLCILAGAFASRSGRRVPSEDGQEARGD